MINLSEIIEQCKILKSNELQLSTERAPQYRVLKGWKEMNFPKITSAWLVQQLEGLLSDEQKIKLMDQGSISGYTELNDQIFQFTISQYKNFFSMHMICENSNIKFSDYALPQMYLEVLKRASGLHIIASKMGGGKSTLSQQILQNISTEEEIAVIFSDEVPADRKSFAHVFPAHYLLANPDLVKGYDTIVVDSLNTNVWRKAIHIVEYGTKVILTLPFVNVEVAIHQLCRRTDSDFKNLCLVLQSFINLKLVKGIETSIQPVCEVVLFNRAVREAFIAQDWNAFEQAMHLLAEKTGMRSLNQSLLNLMLKRKIDIKVGFTESPRPEELDKMLEQVGF